MSVQQTTEPRWFTRARTFLQWLGATVVALVIFEWVLDIVGVEGGAGGFRVVSGYVLAFFFGGVFGAGAYTALGRLRYPR